MTIIGKIQIIKTFIIPIFLYRASLIPLGKDFVKQANKIIFDFIWKGKDKVKRSTLVSEIEDGGLKAPHLESIIETQRVLCCKKLASDQPSTWKTILLHYLKPVGGKLILCCNFELQKLPIRLPKFYDECLRVNVSKYQRKIKKSRSRAKNRFRSFFVYSKFKVLKKVKWQ